MQRIILYNSFERVYERGISYFRAWCRPGDVSEQCAVGVLMLAGILLNSWQMALLAIAGNVVSTLTACLSGYSREDIRNGLYGFNGTLVGIAIGVFMPVSVASFSLLVAGSCLSAWIARLSACSGGCRDLPLLSSFRCGYCWLLAEG